MSQIKMFENLERCGFFTISECTSYRQHPPTRSHVAVGNRPQAAPPPICSRQPCHQCTRLMRTDRCPLSGGGGAARSSGSSDASRSRSASASLPPPCFPSACIQTPKIIVPEGIVHLMHSPGG